ncbi:MAG: ankyrin repeat domain-containing protein [Cyclobacteriaceae bacterium]|nr:ankyrin repeat domain-containing protein [Cyclobacteriaceae bacterium]
MTISRQNFLHYATYSTIGIMLPSISIAQNNQDKPAPINPEIVKEFVGVSHGKFDRVKEMLENDNQLLHVSYDWGGGDFESGIEAAGHVGNKEIAAYLLSKGARYNVYLACMLGHLEVVKQVLTFNPFLLNSKGPHGFTMLHHAQKGGDDAKKVVEYLQSLGATQTKLDFYAKI